LKTPITAANTTTNISPTGASINTRYDEELNTCSKQTAYKVLKQLLCYNVKISAISDFLMDVPND